MNSQDLPDSSPATLDDIDIGLSLVEAKRAPDPRDIIEDEEVEKVRLENRLARSKIKDVKADRRLRKTYANRILRYLEIYSCVVALLTISNGLQLTYFHLDKEIVAALVGSTAVAAIGLVGFIARGLFRPPS